MKETKEIKEIAAKYDARELEKGPVVIEQDEDTVVVVMTPEAYRAWQEWREGERMIEEALRPLQPEIEAYEKLKTELLKTHIGKWVAVHGGRVVDSDDERVALVRRVRTNYPRPFLITQVEEQEQVEDISSPEEIDHVSI